MTHFTHIAADRLGPRGELYRACDGGPLEALPTLYENHPNDPDRPEFVLVFCGECKEVARKVGTRVTTR